MVISKPMNIALLLISIASLWFAGCVPKFTPIAHKMEATFGIPYDAAKLELIEPGTTDLSGILELLGPPEFIIDGTQQIIDTERAESIMSGSIATRTLTAPEGMVILIYVTHFMQMTIGAQGAGVGRYEMESQIDRRNNEIFVFISKKDKKVAFFAAGPVSK